MTWLRTITRHIKITQKAIASPRPSQRKYNGGSGCLHKVKHVFLVERKPDSRGNAPGSGFFRHPHPNYLEAASENCVVTMLS